ncbi:hypothetical protein Hte_000965 [Hypoxylon texense]
MPPHIGVAMERSLQEGSLKDAFVSLLARSTVAALGKRQSVGGIGNEIADAKTAFSSWDNWKRHKYLDDPFIPPNHDQNQAYRSQAPMTPGLSPVPPTVSAPASNTPQYAIFDDSSKKNADSLPAMPSWEGAKSQKVLVEDEPVEMEPLKKPETNVNTALNASNVPHTTPSPVSPGGISPYGAPPGQGGANGYMAPARTDADPYSTHEQGYDQQYDYSGYGQASQDNVNQGYGMAAAGAMGRRTPHNGYDNYNNGYGRGGMDQGYPQSRTPRPYNDEYGRSGTPGSYGAPPSYRTAPSNNGYGNPSRMASPGPQAAGYGGYNNSNARRSPGPQIGFEYPPRSQTQTPGGSNGGGYNRPYPQNPQRQYSNESTRPLVRPAPERQYSEASGPVSPIQNTGGFDFSSGYSRPNTAGGSGDNGGGYQTQTTTGGGAAYPGRRAYRPQGGAQQQQQQQQHQQQQQQQDSWNGV